MMKMSNNQTPMIVIQVDWEDKSRNVFEVLIDFLQHFDDDSSDMLTLFSSERDIGLRIKVEFSSRVSLADLQDAIDDFIIQPFVV